MNAIPLRLLALPLAGLLLLAGCGSDGEGSASSAEPVEATTQAPAEAASTTPTPTQDETPVGPPEARRYESVSELRDDLVAAGYTCGRWDQHDRVKTALQSGSCSDRDVLMIYTGEGAVQEASMALKEMGTSVVVGPNWIVNPGGMTQMVRQMVGGIIVIGDADPTPSPARTSAASLDLWDTPEDEYLWSLRAAAQGNPYGSATDDELLSGGWKACETYDMGSDLRMAAVFAGMELPDDAEPESWYNVGIAAAFFLCTEHEEDVRAGLEES